MDAVQSALLADQSTLTPVQYLDQSSLVQKRQKNYEESSQYRRELRRVGGFESVFPNGVTSQIWKKADVTQSPSGRESKPVILSDSVGRWAARRVQQIDKESPKLLDLLLHPGFTITK